MNRRAVRFASFALIAAAGLVNAQAADLTVRLHGIGQPAGTVRLTVVDGPAGWNGKAAPVAARIVPASGDEVSVAFPGLAPGAYAVMVMHDENGNGKLDTNLVGMPTEGYGFSNDPKVMGKPDFEQARFELGEAGASIDIGLR